jgi:hypothetical protein
VAAELRDDWGAVVVVVVLGVAVVAVDELAVDELAAEEATAVVVDDWPETVVGVADVDVVVWGVAAVDEWAVLPEATRTPSPMAPAEAARPIPTVARRTRAMARSRARAAWRWEGRCDGERGAMAVLSVMHRCPLRPSEFRISVRPSDPSWSRVTSRPAVRGL